LTNPLPHRLAGRVKPLLTASLCALALGAARAAEDRFGVTMLNPTLEGGREWYSQWGQARTVPPYTIDSADPAFRNEEGDLAIAKGIASVKAGLTRLVVLTPAGLPQWRNVEMTIYVRRGQRTRTLDYQAFYLSARSGERHDDSVPCEGTSYHATLRFDGTCGFKKELWHTGGYTALRPDPAPKFWPTVPETRWIGMKAICRNSHRDKHVHLQLYVDAEATNKWQLVSETTDAGGWKGEKPGCDRAQDAILTEPRPAVYFRTEYVDVEVKNVSVREIASLPLNSIQAFECAAE
jgi:hypothetical protein